MFLYSKKQKANDLFPVSVHVIDTWRISLECVLDLIKHGATD